ncbi:MAG: GntR family transcriptional regulator, partial [Alcaligenaceae bacterium]
MKQQKDQQTRRTTLADRVYQQLKDDIGNFVLFPGDRFTENELCDRLSVSRTPLRQALARLQQDGHIEVLFRSGWRILPLDFKKFDQLYDLRILLEIASIKKITARPKNVDKSDADRQLQSLAEIWLVPDAARSSDSRQVSIWDEEFHCVIVRAAGNEEFVRVHWDITERIRMIRKLDFTKRPRIEATYSEHKEILQALIAGEATLACELMTAHIQASQREVRS